VIALLAKLGDGEELMETDLPAARPASSQNIGAWLQSRERYVVFIYLLVLTLIAYWPTLNNTFLGDDYLLLDLGRKIPLSDISQLIYSMGQGFTRPIPLFTWWLHYNIFGLATWPAHLFNVSLHAANAFLIFWILMIGGARRATALFAATLFALAPIAPEVVTWSSGRFDGMALFFMLLAIGLYISSLKRHNYFFFAGSMLAALAALLSKEAALPLLIIIPATEVLFGGAVRGGKKERLHGLFRVLIFFAVFGAYMKYRYSTLQGMGGFSDSFDFSSPSLDATKKTFSTIFAPLNFFIFSKSTTIVLGAIIGILLLISLVMLLLNRRKISMGAVRIWSLFLIFFLVSLPPTYPSFFIYGLQRNLMHSRFLYIPFAAFIIVVVVGALEFGWNNRACRLFVIGLLSLVIPFYFWGLTHNNWQWERASRIAASISDEAVQLLPDPPSGAKLYFLNIPLWQGGAWVYINGLEIAVPNRYGRTDITAKASPPIFDAENGYVIIAAGPSAGETRDGYVFEWDLGTEKLKLKNGPADTVN